MSKVVHGIWYRMDSASTELVETAAMFTEHGAFLRYNASSGAVSVTFAPKLNLKSLGLVLNPEPSPVQAPQAESAEVAAATDVGAALPEPQA